MAHVSPEHPKLQWKAFLRDFLRFASVLLLLLVVGTVLPLAGSVLVTHARSKHEIAERDLDSLQNALRRYHSKHQRYPSTKEGLRALVDSLELDRVPYDPWNYPYGYELREGWPRVWSLGADGAPGGEDEDADVFLPEAH